MREVIPGAPWALDVYCCEGAVSRGLHAAGYNVVGVDLFKHVNAKGKQAGFSRSRYPFPSVQMDAIDALDALLDGYPMLFVHASGEEVILSLGSFALFWGSPPCQHATAGLRAARAQGKNDEPALIEPTRERFEEIRRRTGADWVIENVKGAALRDPVRLCGSMFDLRTDDADGMPLYLERHRYFEASFPIEQPRPCDHSQGWAAGLYGGSRHAKLPKGTPFAEAAPLDRHEARFVRHGGYVPRSADVQRRLLGLPEDYNMTKGGMKECVPPAYAEHIGRTARDWAVL